VTKGTSRRLWGIDPEQVMVVTAQVPHLLKAKRFIKAHAKPQEIKSARNCQRLEVFPSFYEESFGSVSRETIT